MLFLFLTIQYIPDNNPFFRGVEYSAKIFLTIQMEIIWLLLENTDFLDFYLLIDRLLPSFSFVILHQILVMSKYLLIYYL